MIGAGAIAGTLAGGHTNAARSTHPASAEQESAPVAADDNAFVVAPAVSSIQKHAAAAETAQPQRPSAVPAVAPLRFEARWQNVPAARGAEPAGTPVMAFAAEPKRKAAAEIAVNDGFQLASADPAPPMPKRVVRPAQPKSPVLFNDAQLASIKARLKLTREQEQYWPQVEQALRAISWRIATQQDAKRPVRGNQAQMIDPGSPEVQRLKSAAFPLIMSMREDQKREVRQLAHTMGLSQVAAAF
jgi:hypothetical protein